MVKEGQIRKFINGKLPYFKVICFVDDRRAWFCMFEEDFYPYQYFHLTKEELEEKTELTEE